MSAAVALESSAKSAFVVDVHRRLLALNRGVLLVIHWFSAGGALRNPHRHADAEDFSRPTVIWRFARKTSSRPVLRGQMDDNLPRFAREAEAGKPWRIEIAPEVRR